MRESDHLSFSLRSRKPIKTDWKIYDPITIVEPPSAWQTFKYNIKRLYNKLKK